MKKGQITAFIMIGVIILFFSLLLATSRTINEEPVGIDTAIVQMYVEDCADKSLERTLRVMGSKGGYYDASGTEVLTAGYYDESFFFYVDETGAYYAHPPAETLDGYYYNLTYLFYVNKSNLLNEEYTRREMEKGFRSEMSRCINFSSIKGYTITKGYMMPTILVGPDSVFLSLDWPLTIIKGDDKAILTSFSATSSLRFGRAYEMASILLRDEEYHPSLVNDELVTRLEKAYSMKLNSYQFGTDKVIILEDESVEPSFLFVWADKFIANAPPVVNLMDDSLVANVGVPWNATLGVVDPDDSAFTFSILSKEGIRIDQNGVLSYKPSKAGTFKFILHVSDGNNTVTQIYNLEVRP